ncbi:IQ domain-containing protein M [Microtus ochrogaster]|uniref:IQ domain-containing protein M n=1 Tax=Microtus ochrogaster TaxID=79684 RepID=A0ABM0LNF6_MICOH|nr:IQ domain-containing protein M [Microtus ochrogaster]
MATAEAIHTRADGPVLQTTQQDFLQEAKSLIAQHYKRINENKSQGTSINVFKNKHQKPKTGKFIPFEIKKSEILNVVKEHRMVLRSISYPKDASKCAPLSEDLQQISFTEPQVLNIKEKYQPVDLFKIENVKLGKIMTDIESVSKKMEKEKQLSLRKSRMLEPFHSHLGLPLLNLTSSVGLLREPADRMFYDWRSIASMRSSHLPHESVQSLSRSSGIFKDYYMKPYKKKELQPIKSEQKREKRLKTVMKSDKIDSKVKRIGPHIEIYQLFQKRNKLVFTKRIIKLITVTQAFIRGWLERKRLQRIRTKSSYHGPSLKVVITMYQCLIHRIRHRLGLWRTRQIINFGELEEWMDRKKFYETMFAKREDWQGLERSELLKYFNDCGHFPTQNQIDEYWDLFHRHSQGRYSEVIKKSNAIELLFTLYPPQGAKVNISTRLRSTWLRPMVDGEEGYKYIVSGHPILKRANIRTVGKLVARSIRERKMRQFYKS